MNLKSTFTISIFLFLFIGPLAKAQTNGVSVYKFLNLTSSARAAALGGNFMAIKDGDLSQVLFNPSAISKETDNKLALSFVDYYSDISYG